MKTAILTLLTLLLSSSVCCASLSGTYSANFLTGTSGGGAFSYLHSASSNSMMGGAGYEQKAGGTVLFAVDNRDSFTFSFTDNGNDGLNDGDVIDFSFAVDLLEYDGSLDGTNTLLDVIGVMDVFGSLTVGGESDPHSPDFDNALSNISTFSTTASGLAYFVDLNDGSSYTGDAFFQQAAYTGPFNGISYDTVNDSLEFALWGDSRNTTTNNTGSYFDADGNQSGYAMGFDFRISGSMVSQSPVPEPTAMVSWLILGLGFAGFSRRAR